MVLEACPDIVDYARGGINNRRDLAATADTVRASLGASPLAWALAWAQALETSGELDASIVIAAILQRSEEIKSVSSYLRVLAAKARAGEFSLGPVLMALLRGKAARAARAKGGRLNSDLRPNSLKIHRGTPARKIVSLYLQGKGINSCQDQ